MLALPLQTLASLFQGFLPSLSCSQSPSPCPPSFCVISASRRQRLLAQCERVARRPSLDGLLASTKELGPFRRFRLGLVFDQVTRSLFLVSSSSAFLLSSSTFSRSSLRSSSAFSSVSISPARWRRVKRRRRRRRPRAGRPPSSRALPSPFRPVPRASPCSFHGSRAAAPPLSLSLSALSAPLAGSSSPLRPPRRRRCRRPRCVDCVVRFFISFSLRRSRLHVSSRAAPSRRVAPRRGLPPHRCSRRRWATRPPRGRIHVSLSCSGCMEGRP